MDGIAGLGDGTKGLLGMSAILTSTFAPTAMAGIQLVKKARSMIAFAGLRNLRRRAAGTFAEGSS